MEMHFCLNGFNLKNKNKWDEESGVSKMSGMLPKIALTTNKNVVNESILDYHAKQVDTHFKNLPCKTIEELSALDVLLQQENLSVSLVNKIKHFFYHLVNIFFP